MLDSNSIISGAPKGASSSTYWFDAVSANYAHYTGAPAQSGDVERTAAMLATVLHDLTISRKRAGSTFNRDEGTFDKLLCRYRLTPLESS